MEMDRIVLCCVVLIGVTSGCQGVEQLVKQAAEEAVDEALAPGGKNAQGAAAALCDLVSRSKRCAGSWR